MGSMMKIIGWGMVCVYIYIYIYIYIAAVSISRDSRKGLMVRSVQSPECSNTFNE